MKIKDWQINIKAKSLLRMAFCAVMIALMVISVMMIAVSASESEPVCSEGLAFKSNGDGTCSVSGIGTCTDTEIVIPPVSPSGDKVTSIGGGAFIFEDHITGVIIPEGVMGIESYAFCGCSSITSVMIPDSMNYLGWGAFGGCSSLTSVTIPNGATSIEGEVFSNCGSLTSITIPEGVKWIGEYAFDDCRSLKEINIPDGVAGIGESAFGDCTSLTSIHLPESVTYIGHYGINGCSSLTSITVDEGNSVYHSKDNCLIHTESKTLITGCMNSVIPDDGSVTHIGDYAFYDCYSLKNMIIPKGVTSIGYGAFNGCSNLTSMIIPEGVTSIGFSVFNSCTGLTSIVIPKSVKNIDIHAFNECNALTDVYFLGTEKEWDAVIIGKYNSPLLNATIHCNPIYDKNGIAYISNGDGTCYVSGIGYCTDTEIVIPSVGPAGDKVTKIDYAAFRGCNQIVSVRISDGVEIIGTAAFNECDNLVSVTMTNSIKVIGSFAFLDCAKLKYIELSDNIEILEEGALANTGIEFIELPKNLKTTKYDVFYGCTSLRSIHIPANVTDIWDCLLWSCTGLESITVDPMNPVYHSAGNCIIETESKTVIAGCNSSVIPSDGSVTAIGWNAFIGMSFSKISIPSAITDIMPGAFDYCENLTDVYYLGTVAEWKEVAIGRSNEHLLNATIHFLVEPIKTGVYYDRVTRLWLDQNGEPARGIAVCLDNETRCFIDGTPKRIGAAVDADGYVYYFNSTLKAVRNCTYSIGASMTNGLIPAGTYTVDEQGRLVDGRGELVRAETAMADGFKYFADGTIRYYVDGKPARAGLVADEAGNLYYINSTLKAVRGTWYSFSETMSNGLLPAGTYYFDESGKLVLE